MPITWVAKYQPTSLSEFINNTEAIGQLEKWLHSWEDGFPSKRGAFLYGPPGVGKTSSVYVLAKELGYDTVEMNASDWRNRKAIERIIGAAASQSTLYGLSRRIVILDELEGISGTEDREGLSALTEIVRKSLSPIALITADAWNPKFRELRNYCILIEFKRIPTRSILPHLKRICQVEGIAADDNVLQLIADRSGGDLRSAIIDLQALSQDKKQLRYEDVTMLGLRDRGETIFNVLKVIFNANNCSDARKAAEVTDVDFEMLFEWIYENAPYQLTDRQDLCEAMGALARADLYFHRIRASQNWDLLPYALDSMTAAVAMSRKRTKSGWIPFKFPQRISLIARSRENRRRKHEIAIKIGEKCHLSEDAAVKEMLPYIKIILSKGDERVTSEIAEKLNLHPEEISYLKSGS